MLIHSVYFWLKGNLSEDQTIAFREGLESLRKIETVASIHIGTPAKTEERAVIDNSYSFALVVLFQSLEAQDLYQVHPLHQAFLGKFASSWKKVLVYDVEVP